MKIPLFFCFLLFAMPFLGYTCGASGSDSTPEDEVYLLDSAITATDIYYHISILASDSLEGRDAGSRGEFEAGNYIQKQFEYVGLKAFSNNYFQPFSFFSRGKNPGSTLSFGDFQGINGIFQGINEEDFYAIGSLDSTKTFAGEVVFVDFGFQYALPQAVYDKEDINNKWLLMFTREKDAPGMPKMSRPLLFRMKDAMKKGAGGVLLVDLIDEPRTSYFESYTDGRFSIPIIKVSGKVADNLFRHVNLTKEDVAKKLENNPGKCVIPIPVEVTASIRVDSLISRNVVAFLEGKDPVLKDEYIVLGAHYDHLGKRNVFPGESNAQVYYGADDNASGTAGLLEIAQRLSFEKDLKRSVIFVAFGAEEQGLLGSYFFVDHLPVPREKIALMVNMDMIGRMNPENKISVNAIDPKDTANVVLKKLVTQFPELKLMFPSRVENNTDHFPFYEQNIPVVSFTTGLHPDYHSPRDTVGAINCEGEKRALDLIYELVKTKINN